MGRLERPNTKDFETNLPIEIGGYRYSRSACLTRSKKKLQRIFKKLRTKQADRQCNRPFQWAGWNVLKKRILKPTCRLKSAVTSNV